MPHIHDKIDFCAETFIVYKDTVLLRKHDKYKIWLSVGGHIELHEDPNQAAVREAFEEVGLKIELFAEEGSQPIFQTGNTALIPPQYLDRHHISDQHEHIALVYFGKSDSNVLKLSETEVTAACRWFTKEELNAPDCEVREDIKFFALKALEKLSTHHN